MFAGRFILDGLEGQFLAGLCQKVTSAHGKWALKITNFYGFKNKWPSLKRFVFYRGVGDDLNLFCSKAKIAQNFCSRAKFNFLEPW